jgi:Uncharacterized protein encoded in toxicity protection region of plasmid R478, contains von Willebrand factor (vWF) domain
MNNEILDRPVRSGAEPHVALALVLDVSASMSESKGFKINELNKAVNDLISQVKQDSRLQNIVDLGIFVFGEKGKQPIHQGFRAMADCVDISLVANDESTHVVSALEKAIEMVRTRCGIYDEGGGAYKPWIVLITDGEFHDSPSELNTIARKMKDRETEGKLQFFGLGVKGYERSQLAQLTNKPSHVIDVDARNFTEFLSWVGKSMAVISTTAIDATVELPDLELKTYRFSV